jgi:hypothetical protein
MALTPNEDVTSKNEMQSIPEIFRAIDIVTKYNYDAETSILTLQINGFDFHTFVERDPIDNTFRRTCGYDVLKTLNFSKLIGYQALLLGL